MSSLKAWLFALGIMLMSWGSGEIRAQFPDHYLLVSGYGSQQLHRYDTSASPVTGPPFFVNQGTELDGMIVDSLGRLHLARGNGSVVRYAVDFSSSTVITMGGPSLLDMTTNGTHLFHGSFNGIWRSNLSGGGMTNIVPLSTINADGVRMGSDGKLYAVNASNGEILRFANPSGPGPFVPEVFLPAASLPVGLASQMEFGPDGRVYVSRTIGGEARIYRYSYNTVGDTTLLNPASQELYGVMGGGLATGIRFGPDGRLYANNFGDSSVWRSTSSDLTFTGMSLFIAGGVGGLSGPGSLMFVPIPEPGLMSGLGLLGAAAGLAIRRRGPCTA